MEKKIIIENVKQTPDRELYDFFYKKSYNQEFVSNQNEAKNKFLDYLFAIHMLDAEVCNGGFDQFFRNNGFDFYFDDALIGLQNIGALEIKALLENALKIYLESARAYSTSRNPEYNDLDNKFYKLNKQEADGLKKLNKLQIRFIRENFRLFDK